MMLAYRTSLACLVSFTVAGCTDDPVSYSAPVGINLKAKSSDTANGVVSNEKGITTESGNPFGAFVGEAERTLGRDPGRIEVSTVELFLGASSTGVTRLGEVFTGTVDVVFQMNDTNNSFPVATATLPDTAPAGPVPLEVTFDGAAVTGVDYDKLLGGSFKVIVRGASATGFETKGAEADLQATLVFAAFE